MQEKVSFDDTKYGCFMKKVFFVLFVLLITVFSFAANFLFGGGVSLTSNKSYNTKSNRYSEFGITMYNNSSFEMHNLISIDDYGKNIFNN